MTETAYRPSPQQERALRIAALLPSGALPHLEALYTLTARPTFERVAAAVDAVLSGHEIFRTVPRSTAQGCFQFVADAPNHIIEQRLLAGDLPLTVEAVRSTVEQGVRDPERVFAVLCTDVAQKVAAVYIRAPGFMLDAGSCVAFGKLLANALSSGAQKVDLQYADVFDSGVTLRSALAATTVPGNCTARIEIEMGDLRELLLTQACRWELDPSILYFAASAAIALHCGQTSVQWRVDARVEPELAEVLGPLDGAVLWQPQMGSSMRLRGLAENAAEFLHGIDAVQAALQSGAVDAASAFPVEVLVYDQEPLVRLRDLIAPVPPARMALRWIDDGARARAWLLFDPALVSSLEASLLAGGIPHWLASALKSTLPLTHLSLSSESLRNWYVHSSEEKVQAVEDFISLPGAIAHWALHTPAADALCTNAGRTISYAVLDQQCRRIAEALRARGVASGDRVVLAMARSEALYTVMLGVMYIGACYVPIDPHHPNARNGAIVADAAAALLIVDDLEYALQLQTEIAVADAADLLRSINTSEALVMPHPQAAAYVVYTSGTTGNPKGVVVSHAAIVTYARSLATRTGIVAGDRLGMLSTVAADLGYTSVFGAWVAGACLCSLPEHVMLDGVAAKWALDALAVDYLKIVPSHWLALSDQAEAAGLGLPLPRKALIFGGDRLDHSVLNRIYRQTPDFPIYNHYGPTETTVGVVADLVASGASPIALGRPLAHVKAYVVDTYDALCLPEQEGELAFGGTSLAWGYWQRPGATAERFRPDPEAGAYGARRYLTGDRGRVDASGAYYFLGRRDDQIKFNGQRVELGEIEAALRAEAQCSEISVLIDTRGSGQILRAFLKSAKALDTAALRLRLSERLPEHMIPASLHLVVTMPLAANGKVDRTMLLQIADQESIAGVIAAATPTEIWTRDLWSELLEVAPTMIGTDTNFFRIGGHSLQAARMLARVRHCHRCDISIKQFFEQPTLAALAALIDNAESRRALIPLRALGERSSYPLSSGQQRLWSIAASGASDIAYNSCYVMRLTGTLDEGRLVQALQIVASRHQPLHGRIVVDVNGEASMQLQPRPLLVERTSLLGRLDSTLEARRIGRASARRAFDLSAEPPVRVLLAQVDEEAWILQLVVHHIAWDGWSNGVLVQELISCYAQGAEALSALPISYGEFAVAEREALESGALDPVLSYWQRQLHGLPTLDLRGIDYARPRAPFSGAQVASSLPTSVVAGLHSIAGSERATTFMVLLAVWYVALNQHTGQSDLPVGTSVANRGQSELEGLIGFFVNQVVLRGDLTGNPSFRDLLRRVRTMAIDAYEHQTAPFSAVVSRMQELRRSGRAPLYQSMFVMQSAGGSTEPVAGVRWIADPADVEHAKFDLTLYVAEHVDGALDATLVYDQSLIEHARAQRIANDFVLLAELLSDAPDAPIAAALSELSRRLSEQISERKFQGLKKRRLSAEPSSLPQQMD